MSNIDNSKISYTAESFLVKRFGRVSVLNQKTGKEISYDEASLYWLNKITHSPQVVSEIINSIKQDFPNVTLHTIVEDFQSLIKELCENQLIVLDNEVKEPVNDNEYISDYIPVLSEITIELTNRCNERCIHCYLGENKFKNGNLISESQVKNLIDQFVNLGGKSITFTGGEILLYSKIWEVLKYANDRGLEISIFSNLLQLTNENIENLKGLNIVDIQTSLYSSIPAIHNKITQVDKSCEKTLLSIIKLKKNEMPVRIACPLMKENKDSIVGLIQFCKNNGLPINIDLCIQAQYDGNSSNLSHRLSLEEMESTLISIKNFDRNLCNDYLRRHCFDKCLSTLEFINQPICSAGHNNLYICADGTVAACPTLQGYSLGNINDNTISEIWKENKLLLELRNATQTKFPNCLTCDFIDYCGRCFAVNFTEQKDLWQIPPYKCSIAKITKKISDL